MGKAKRDNTIKIRFFDFDGTLINHDFPTWYMLNKSYEEMLKCWLKKDIREELISGDRPLKCMQWYSRDSLTKNIKNICLTHEMTNIRSKYKKSRLKQWYNDADFEYYEVDSSEHKIDFIRAYASINGIKLNECELIDDKSQTRHLAIENGIKATSVSAVAAKYDEYTSQLKPRQT